VTLASGDKVSFQMATMQRSGTLVARAIRLENPAKPVKYQGVVNSIKELGKFGFIERYNHLHHFFMTFIQSFTVLNKHLRFEKVKLHCNN
jgi:hypothetical protein